MLSRDTEEQRIRARLEALELALDSPGAEDPALRKVRIERALSDALAEDVLVKIPDQPRLGRGRAGLLELALRAGDDPRGVEVRVAHVEIALGDDRRTARVRLDAELSRPGDELHKDVRNVTLDFESSNGSWRITSVEAGERLRAEPEARP
jgi:hypothetical protein